MNKMVGLGMHNRKGIREHYRIESMPTGEVKNETVMPARTNNSYSGENPLVKSYKDKKRSGLEVTTDEKEAFHRYMQLNFGGLVGVLAFEITKK